MIEVENTDVNIVRNIIPMRNLMPASAYGLKAISDWFLLGGSKAAEALLSTGYLIYFLTLKKWPTVCLND